MKILSRYIRALIFGLICSPVGWFVGIKLMQEQQLAIHATLAAFVAPALTWYILEKYKGLSLSTGAATGALSSIIAHYFCWCSLTITSTFLNFKQIAIPVILFCASQKPLWRLFMIHCYVYLEFFFTHFSVFGFSV